MKKGKVKNNKQGGGHPPKQQSVEEEEIRPKKNIQRHRDCRENEKCEFISLQKQQELFMEFCEEKGITEEGKAFCEKHEEEVEERRKLCETFGMVSEALENEAKQHSDEEIQKILKNSSKNPWATLEENLESEMIQTVGLEGVTAAGSSSLGAMGTPFE
ncbi:hypothetical protein SLEP1_g29659 [Rubroshorea leprosula]|uniref:Uncharacterized protein n=1 Tax=Rubroshorea leprosula TaxID=152421 RepID=A0AAV5JXM4_9ROSI|nr:hypothetical protein SLEP1_g29659 [Rubroshorea leprosula]